MLSRIYIDNYRCLVNFELRLQSKQLIIGANGSGKSALVEALRCLRDFAFGGYKVHDVFPLETRTRWQTVPTQVFEFEVDAEDGTYVYTLWLEAENDSRQPHVLKEMLELNKKPLLLFQDDQVQLFDDNHVKKATYPFESNRSALPVLGRRKASRKLAWFKDWLEKLYCLRINPEVMGAESEDEDEYPEDDLANFASWYAHIIQEQTSSFLDLQRALQDVIDGFDSLELRKAGRTARVLRAVFAQSLDDHAVGRRKQRLEFDFDELSDGQRVLIVLYTILYCVVGSSTTICIDEPENFVALAEIQPWLFALSDRIEDTHAQAILISHHPELIDLLAPDCGVVFSRTGFGPVRVEPYRADSQGKLSPSEHIARGWEHG